MQIISSEGLGFILFYCTKFKLLCGQRWRAACCLLSTGVSAKRVQAECQSSQGFSRMADVEERKFEPDFGSNSPSCSWLQSQGGLCWAQQGGLCLMPRGWNENRLLQILIPAVNSSCQYTSCSALLEGQRGSSSQESLVVKQWGCHWAEVSVRAVVAALSAEFSRSHRKKAEITLVTTTAKY